MIKGIVAALTLKRIPDNEIIKEVFNQTNKTISLKQIYNVRQRIKRDSYQWYTVLRQDQYAYINEFKERINEIMDLQKRCHELIESNKNNPQVQLSAIAELHRLNITYSNYVEIIPSLIGNININGTSPIPTNAPDDKTVTTEESESIITV